MAWADLLSEIIDEFDTLDGRERQQSKLAIEAVRRREWRRAYDRERYHHRLTPAEQQRRREYQREYMRDRRRNEAPEQAERRRARDREYYYRLTPAERAARHAQMKRTRKATRQRWTPEQHRRHQMKRRAAATRLRLKNRAPIECANPRCRVMFVPYRSVTLYCTQKCQARARQYRYWLRLKRKRAA